MRIDHIETFCFVAEDRNFSTAARRLNLSQSTVSAHIRNIEDELGIQLLDRGGKPTTLTEEGERILPLLREMLQTYRRIVQLARGQGTINRQLRVGAGFGVAEFIIPQVMADYKGDLGQLELVLSVGNHQSMVDEVLSGKVDLSIVSSMKPTAGSSRLTEIPFLRDPLVVVVPSAHPWAHRDVITAEEMLQEVYVLRERGAGARRVIDAILESHGLGERLRVAGNYGSNRACISAVCSGLGLSILPFRAVAEEVSEGRLSALLVLGLSLVQHLQIICLPENAGRSEVTLFIHCLKKYAVREQRRLNTAAV